MRQAMNIINRDPKVGTLAASLASGGRYCADLGRHPGGITSGVVFKMLDEMTKEGAMFHDGMLNFAETTIGLMTSVNDMVHRAMADTGDLLNKVVGLGAKFLINNGIWKEISDWLLSKLT